MNLEIRDEGMCPLYSVAGMFSGQVCNPLFLLQDQYIFKYSVSIVSVFTFLCWHSLLLSLSLILQRFMHVLKYKYTNSPINL